MTLDTALPALPRAGERYTRDGVTCTVTDCSGALVSGSCDLAAGLTAPGCVPGGFCVPLAVWLEWAYAAILEVEA